MSIQLSKGKHILFMLAIVLTNVIVMNSYVIMPIVNALYEQFPGNIMGVNFIVSGPSIIMFAASLLVPYLLRFVKKRTLLCLSCIVFTVSSIGAAAIVSVPYMILTHSIIGFCYGIVQVVAMDIVADYFIDENKRASFMGIYNAGMAAVGAVMGVLAGNLAVTGWRNAYATFLLAIPMTLLVLFFVPKMEGQSAGMAEEETVSTEKAPMGRVFWIMLVTYILFNICYTPMMMMSSVYIAENNLGTESLAGLAASAGTVGSAIFCLAFGFLYSKMKGRTSVLSFSLMALGLLAMYFLPNRYMIIAVCAWSGGGYGMMFSYIYAHVPAVIPPQNISKAISYITAATGFAMFVGIYVVTGLMGMLGIDTVTPVTLIFGIVMVVCIVVTFMNTAEKK